MEKINLIFDCDGTILDSYQSIVDWICRTLAFYQIEADEDEIRKLALYYDVNHAFKVYSERYQIDYEKLREYSRNIQQDLALIVPYPHLVDVLNKEIFNCFVYTHRGVTCKEVLQKYDLADKFIEIIDSTYYFKKKPDSQAIDYLVEKYGLKKDNTYYVGDRLLDIQCGINSGIKTIFFTSAKIDIDCSLANYVIDDLADLCKIEF